MGGEDGPRKGFFSRAFLGGFFGALGVLAAVLVVTIVMTVVAVRVFSPGDEEAFVVVTEITPAGTNWVVTTVAGSSSSGAVDGNGSAARLFRPTGLALDANGTLYVADSANDTLRLAWPAPALAIQWCAGQAILSWPVSPGQYALEKNTALSPGTNWMELDTDPITNGNILVVTNAPNGPDSFYRLRLR